MPLSSKQPLHSLAELFAQLGLPNEPAAITAFIAAHAPLDSALLLEDAPFWSAAQSELLKEKLLEDANWSAAVDELNAELRARPD